MKALFIFILLILVIGGGYFGSIILVKEMRSARAETMAEKYVADLYSEYRIIGKICQGEDTNNDSYVSCDIRIRIAEDLTTEKVLPLSCPTIWKSYTGNTCKESRLQIPGLN